MVEERQLTEINRELEGKSAEERIQWAVNEYGDALVLSSSFGIQAAVMLHLATSVAPDIPVIFIDTGYLFPETYRFAEELAQRLSLNVKKYHALQTAAEQEALHGRLWEQGSEGLKKYNFFNKVEPMNRALSELGAKAWLAGLRRHQSSTREHLKIIDFQSKLLKVLPIIDWSDRDVYYYLKKHDLPYHPLWEKNYISIGDWHSSAPLRPGMKSEETRFNGIKRECGIHELSGRIDFQI
ncbi:MAG: phosphoadenylyl-sulfate reductase [Opitutales bacterium]